ncbi:hypothetical protein JTB14_029716 [Gonioctena quinquepunctata]|nr:hypothetical protein JTB14_029716 [Gonioctena quinquepunctata]
MNICENPQGSPQILPTTMERSHGYMIPKPNKNAVIPENHQHISLIPSMSGFLYELKSKTKKKACVNRENILQTGGGGYKCTDLNEFENRLISIHGWVHIVGCPGAPDEVDPDNNGKSRTFTPELPTREILLEYDNNDEIIHIAGEADNFPPS